MDNKKLYPITKLKNDLFCDLLRYMRMLGFDNELTIIKIFLVLIKYPRIFSIIIYRFSYFINIKYKEDNNNPILKVLNYINYLMQYISIILFKIYISEWTEVGPGFMVMNKGNIIIGAKRIGRNCTIHSNVTLGINIGIKANFQPPEIGDNVSIGTGSLIYGDIKVGNNAIIENSSVVSRDVSEGSIVGGNPMHILK